MLKPSEAGFRRLLPLLRPHLRQLSLGLVCMVVYVSSFLLLLNSPVTCSLRLVPETSDVCSL